MKKQTPKTSEDVISGSNIKGDHIPPKNRNIVNQEENEIDEEKDMDEQSHDETGETLNEDEEKDMDDAIHQESDEPYPEDSEEDIDDLLHKNDKGIY